MGYELDKLLFTPELLLPGVKPTENVVLIEPENFIGYWLLTDNTIDLSTRNHHGVLEGNSTFAVESPGSVVTFDGSTGTRINCGNIDVSGLAEFTLTVLARMDGSGSDEHSFASNWDNLATTAGILLRSDPSASNQIEGFVCTQTNVTHGGNFTDLQMVTNQYHIITMRFNANDGSGLTAFLDGAKSGITFPTSTSLDSNVPVNNFYIGSSPHSPVDGLTGAVAACMLNNRALSDDEVFYLHLGLYKDLKPAISGIWVPVAGAVTVALDFMWRRRWQ